MTERITVEVIDTEDGRRPDYDEPFNDAKYWFHEGNVEEYGLQRGEVSIIPTSSDE